MIRDLNSTDLDAVMDIWLQSNIQAHSFIPKSYWEDHFEIVKEMLPSANVYVYEHEHQIAAFVGLDHGHIAGIFVSSDMRSISIGKALLDHCKSQYDTLSLCVYEDNKGALRFYQREGFHIEKTQIDEETGRTECRMTWSR